MGDPELAVVGVVYYSVLHGLSYPPRPCRGELMVIRHEIPLKHVGFTEIASYCSICWAQEIRYRLWQGTSAVRVKDEWLS